MGVIIGVIVGYVMGTRAGDRGLTELKDAWNPIRSSDEARDIIHALKEKFPNIDRPGYEIR